MQQAIIINYYHFSYETNLEMDYWRRSRAYRGPFWGVNLFFEELEAISGGEIARGREKIYRQPVPFDL